MKTFLPPALIKQEEDVYARISIGTQAAGGLSTLPDLPKIHSVPDRRPELPFSWMFRSFLLYRTLFSR